VLPDRRLLPALLLFETLKFARFPRSHDLSRQVLQHLQAVIEIALQAIRSLVVPLGRGSQDLGLE
jgi:hypothetical protein